MSDPDYKRLWLQACDSYDRKNPSGCVCAIHADTEAIRSPCALHAAWRDEAITTLRAELSAAQAEATAIQEGRDNWRHAAKLFRDERDAAQAASALAARRVGELEADAVDAARWRAFVSELSEGGSMLEAPTAHVQFTPSGYDGSKWASLELAWKHPQWTKTTAEHANAAIDAARASSGEGKTG